MLSRLIWFEVGEPGKAIASEAMHLADVRIGGRVVRDLLKVSDHCPCGFKCHSGLEGDVGQTIPCIDDI